MPASVVKTKADKKFWSKAKEYASKTKSQADKQYWGLVMTIFKSMKEKYGGRPPSTYSEEYAYILEVVNKRYQHRMALIEKLVLPIKKIDLNILEKQLDRLFAKLDIDVEFTKHFFDRVNDARNKEQITIDELAELFNDVFKKYGEKIAGMSDDDEAVVVDVSSDINVPFVINITKNGMEMISKTVMRKKGFKTRTRRLVV